VTRSCGRTRLLEPLVAGCAFGGRRCHCCRCCCISWCWCCCCSWCCISWRCCCGSCSGRRACKVVGACQRMPLGASRVACCCTASACCREGRSTTCSTASRARHPALSGLLMLLLPSLLHTRWPHARAGLLPQGCKRQVAPVRSALRGARSHASRRQQDCGAGGRIPRTTPGVRSAQAARMLATWALPGVPSSGHSTKMQELPAHIHRACTVAPAAVLLRG
jgi:hypothetical protein